MHRGLGLGGGQKNHLVHVPPCWVQASARSRRAPHVAEPFVQWVWRLLTKHCAHPHRRQIWGIFKKQTNRGCPAPSTVLDPKPRCRKRVTFRTDLNPWPSSTDTLLTKPNHALTLCNAPKSDNSPLQPHIS